MAFELITDVDDEIHQLWTENVKQASRTETEEIEHQLIEVAKQASLAEVAQEEYQEPGPLAISQANRSKKSVRFGTYPQNKVSPTVALKIVGNYQNTSLPAGTADDDLTPPHSETDGTEADSEPDTSTEEGLSPADGHNINAPNSDRPITSLPFVEWPNEVRQQMLISMLIRDGESIIPYYHEGSVEGTRDETEKPNYDITMLLATAGEPRLYQQALEIFYGQNVWEFRNPRVALWWLKKLGTKIALLRHINLYLTQGWWGIGSTPLEKLWYILIVWMKPRVELATIHVSFAQWDYSVVHPNEEPPMKYFPVAESRLGVWSTLLSFRGLNVVDITPGPFVPYKYAAALVRSMILVGDQVDPEAERLRRRWHKQVYLGI